MMARRDEATVNKLWSLCSVMKDDGVTYHQYLNELTYLLYIKMVTEADKAHELPPGCQWQDLVASDARTLLQDSRELRSLSVQLNSMAVSRTHPNPYFNQFADALARRRSSSGYAPLTREELMEQKGIADEVLAEVLAEEAAGDDS